MAAVVALAGCGDDGPDLDDDAAWRTSSDPVETSGLAWATGSTVTLGDGTTVETGEPVRAFLVAGDGVFFVPGGEGDDTDTQFRDADLLFVAPGEEPVDTGLDVADDGVAVSPDGRHLVVLDADRDSGEAVVRLFDLETGEARTSDDGMEPDGDDPVSQLLEAEVQVWGTTDEEVHVAALEGDYAYDLATGEGRPLGDDERLGLDPLESPDGRWRIVETGSRTDRLEGPEGQRVVPAAGTDRWDLSFWADARTVVGNTVEGPGRSDEPAPADRQALMACVVPTGECTVFEETAGARVVVPLGAAPYGAVTFPGGSGDTGGTEGGGTS